MTLRYISLFSLILLTGVLLGQGSVSGTLTNAVNGEPIARCFTPQFADERCTVEAFERAADESINARTVVPHWTGESMDMGMAIEALLVRAHGRRVLI